MLITITLASIIVLTVLVWVIRKISQLEICPICAGVSGTWLGLLVAHFLGYPIALTIPALLLGGTVVGAMTKLERFIKSKFVLIWKTVFVVSGFLAAYSLVTGDWLIFAVGVIFALVVTLTCKTPKVKLTKTESELTEELEKKLKNCC